MAYRGGWGRGRGRGRGQMPRAKLLPYILFPEDVVLPSLPDSLSTEERKLIQSKYKLELFWSGSCYHLKQESFTRSKEKSKFGKEVEDVEIERYSDRHKQRTHAKREALESYLKKIPSNFPSELIQGVKQSQRATKKLRWDRDLGDVLAKLEEEESKASRREDMERRLRNERAMKMIAETRKGKKKRRKMKNIVMMVITIRMSILMTTRMI